MNYIYVLWLIFSPYSKDVFNWGRHFYTVPGEISNKSLAFGKCIVSSSFILGKGHHLNYLYCHNAQKTLRQNWTWHQTPGNKRQPLPRRVYNAF